ncbi:hypothetical protein PHYPSEUDO_015036 [Phytophthora pseudosyringae]|uniref:B box-type domain-containing protein n=1 Tax=Phytophthora pseudosyringae TaxID=221518 RepID=A0A8T1WJH7_9STRA|nr:hypothetical protein PHYPSEUDO_015036 [Phytophthora pseudosyringae]
MAAVEAIGARAEGGADAWSGMLTNAVVKCGRDSERRIYMYGISSSRCPKCQAKLRADNNTCVSCHYTHKTLRKCTRCSQKDDPVMWCVECDAYFCASCHKKPHVLMLGSSKPHHCFAIDSASGKHIVEAAWSDEFTAMVQATYRLHLHDKMLADEAKAKAPTKATGQQATPVVTEVVGQTASAGSASSTARPPAASAAANGDAVLSSTSTATTTPATGAQEQSRKRLLPGPEDTQDRIQKSIRADEGGKQAATPADGMSLYDRVKAMHDMRAKRAAQSNAPQARSPKMSETQLLSEQNEERMRQKNELEERGKRESDHILNQRDQQRQQEQERVERLKKEQQRQEQGRVENLRDEQRRLEQERVERLRLEQQQREHRRQEDQRRQEGQRQQQEEQKRQDVQRRHLQQEEQRRQEELRQQEQIREQQRQQRLMEERMRHEQILREQEARRQAEAQSLMHQGNQYISQAQHVLHTQAGYVVASMAPSNISAPMPQSSNSRFSRVPSPVNVSPHAPRFQPDSPPATSQSFLFPSAHSAPVTNAYSSMGNGPQVHQGHAGAPVSRFETISQDHDGNHHLVVRDAKVQPQLQQADFSDAMVSHRMTGGSGGGFSPSKSGEDDELRAIWVSDYDNVNALVMQLDVEITKRTEEGHKFVHRSNNITIPEQLKLQINNLRAQRDAAIKKRFESVVRVLIFSEAVRSFAQQNEHTNVWSDVPEVLKVSHKKCAELAVGIREFERQAQKLRVGIDEAVSSGNPAQMQNVAHLGSLIADLERKIRASNGERDKQFIFMFQFSDTLRNMVRAEWAASGRGYQLQASQ